MKIIKEFRFKGVDLKTELILGFMLSIPLMIIVPGFFYLIHVLSEGSPVAGNLLWASSLILASSVLLLKFFTKRIKNRLWVIKAGETELDITFRDKHYSFSLSEIRIIKNLGGHGLRYLTIITKKEKVRIRVGDIALAPFSTQKDIEEVDAFVAYLKPYINRNFNKKRLKNKIFDEIFPNYGVYVVKSEKIKYSLINRMYPWQVVLLILSCVVLFLLLLIYGVFIYSE